MIQAAMLDQTLRYELQVGNRKQIPGRETLPDQKAALKRDQIVAARVIVESKTRLLQDIEQLCPPVTIARPPVTELHDPRRGTMGFEQSVRPAQHGHLDPFDIDLAEGQMRVTLPINRFI